LVVGRNGLAAIGIVGAVIIPADAMGSLLFVTATDTVTFGAVVLILAAVAFSRRPIPWRAGQFRVDPMVHCGRNKAGAPPSRR
jgi:hypothetical protein